MPDMKLDIFSQTDESRVQQGTNDWTGAEGNGALFVPNDVRLIAQKKAGLRRVMAHDEEVRDVSDPKDTGLKLGDD